MSGSGQSAKRLGGWAGRQAAVEGDNPSPAARAAVAGPPPRALTCMGLVASSVMTSSAAGSVEAASRSAHSERCSGPAGGGRRAQSGAQASGNAEKSCALGRRCARGARQGGQRGAAKAGRNRPDMSTSALQAAPPMHPPCELPRQCTRPASRPARPRTRPRGVQLKAQLCRGAGQLHHLVHVGRRVAAQQCPAGTAGGGGRGRSWCGRQAALALDGHTPRQ